MKIWKLVLGFLGLVGGLFAANASKNKEVKKLKKVIDENKKDEDLDLSLNESTGISIARRLVFEGLVVTTVTATTSRAIVLGDEIN